MIHKNKKNRKKLLLIVVPLLLLTGVVTAFWLSKEGAPVDDGTSYEAATQAEKDETERHKDNLAEEISNGDDSGQTDDGNVKKQVHPLISSWGQAGSGADFKLNGYVPEVIETDGNCTVTMKKDGISVTQDKVAFFNAQNTSCGQIVIPFSKLTVGSWQVELSYSSPDSSGVSEALTYEVK